MPRGQGWAHRETCRRWYQQHAAQKKEYARLYRVRLRNEMLQAYGRQCTCCGESQPEFLAFDHVKNDGAYWRKVWGQSPYQLALWAKKHNFPSSIQILCHNCNNAKAYYGLCPHATTSSQTVS